MNDVQKDLNSQGMLEERLLDYAVRVIAVAQALPKSRIGAHIAGQIVRSGTSAGANYCEALGSESRKDFVHKMQITLKELRETEYWLRIIRKTALLPCRRLSRLMNESNELISMTVASVVTAKKRTKHEH